MVVPSGTERATAAAAVVPPAPGRGSTTIVWPRRLPSCSAIRRATMSTLAPGVNPCIIVMVRPLWAKAGTAARAERPVSAARRVKLVVMVVVSRSLSSSCRRGRHLVTRLAHDAGAGFAELLQAARQHVGGKREPAVLLAHDAVNDHGIDIAGAGDLHDRINGVVDRRHVDVVRPQHGDVRLLARRQRADPVLHHEGAGAADGRPFERLAGPDRQLLERGIAAQRIVADLSAEREQQRRLHLAEYLAAAERLDVDADRWQAAGGAEGGDLSVADMVMQLDQHGR